jgi:NADPH:quinone reductase-like Zn-dependent oxidoreductase
VHAAGLNGADMHQLAGHYPAPPGAPQDIPGLELAGEVIDRGPGAERFDVGDRVMSIVGGGGQAELAVVHERTLMPIPDNLSWPEAGGLPEVFTTAHDAVFTQAGLEMGERLLVHGAAGGVGLAAVQLGRAAGARVTATVRNPDLRDRVAAFGATVLAHDAFADHGPFDVILELVGAVNLMDNLKALETGGRITVIGMGAGATGEINLGLLLVKRGRIHGSTLRSRPLEQKALTARAMERSVLPLFAAGTVSVPVAETYPLDQAPAAYDHFKRGGKLGKIVLTID